jgi:hypothetical protein
MRPTPPPLPSCLLPPTCVPSSVCGLSKSCRSCSTSSRFPTSFPSRSRARAIAAWYPRLPRYPHTTCARPQRRHLRSHSASLSKTRRPWHQSLLARLPSIPATSFRRRDLYWLVLASSCSPSFSGTLSGDQKPRQHHHPVIHRLYHNLNHCLPQPERILLSISRFAFELASRTMLRPMIYASAGCRSRIAVCGR